MLYFVGIILSKTLTIPIKHAEKHAINIQQKLDPFDSYRNIFLTRLNVSKIIPIIIRM